MHGDVSDKMISLNVHVHHFLLCSCVVLLLLLRVCRIIFISLSVCRPHCLPQSAVSFCSSPLSPSFTVCISICLPPLICVSPYQLESDTRDQNKPWLVGFGRCAVRLKTKTAPPPEIFPSVKPRNNTGIFLLLNYSTVLNLIPIPSHAPSIALLTMHACILLYIIAFSALWFSSIPLRRRSCQGFRWVYFGTQK